MLTLNPDQLGDAAQLRFESRLAALIAQGQPEAAAELESPEGRAMLRRQCRRAERYGLRTELELARYVITAWLMGPQFDEELPAMAEILNAPSLTPAQKAEAIERVASTVLEQLSQGRT
ncbi:hypothetical protein [Inhella sp.]|uniref:hypothetical protein n=1 Tax=Inhella sp. TaxID=1921806 RepID=UPI0035ADCDDE